MRTQTLVIPTRLLLFRLLRPAQRRSPKASTRLLCAPIRSNTFLLPERMLPSLKLPKLLVLLNRSPMPQPATALTPTSSPPFESLQPVCQLSRASEQAQIEQLWRTRSFIDTPTMLTRTVQKRDTLRREQEPSLERSHPSVPKRTCLRKQIMQACRPLPSFNIRHRKSPVGNNRTRCLKLPTIQRRLEPHSRPTIHAIR